MKKQKQTPEIKEPTKEETAAAEAAVKETIEAITKACEARNTSLQLFLDYTPMAIVPRARVVINEEPTKPATIDDKNRKD